MTLYDGIFITRVLLQVAELFSPTISETCIRVSVTSRNTPRTLSIAVKHTHDYIPLYVENLITVRNIFRARKNSHDPEYSYAL